MFFLFSRYMAKELVPGIKVGSVGDLIYYLRNGKQCVRRKPKHQRVSNTERQRAGREGFARLSKVASLLLPAARVGLHKVAQRRGLPVYNVFVSLNGGAVSAEGVDYGRLKVSAGHVGIVAFEEATVSREVCCRWGLRQGWRRRMTRCLRRCW